MIAIIGPWIAPYDPNATTTTQSLPGAAEHPPSVPEPARPAGTSCSQVLVDLRATVVLGLLTAVIATILSVLVGMAAGFLGGLRDEGLSLVSNVFLVLPALPLLVVILGYLPHTGEAATAIVLSALGWAWGARVIRAQTLSLRNRDFVLAAREVGERPWRIIFYELLPNQIGLIAASFVGVFLYAILTSVALAFLGITNFADWNYGDILFWAQSGSADQLGAW